MKATSEQLRFHDFGPFRVDTVRRLLLREGSVVALTPKAFEILLVLLRNSQRVVDKDELMHLVWPDTAVEENNLTRNVSTLRKALEEGPNEHRYIVTLPGRGYQFVSEQSEFEPQTEVIVQRHARAEIQIEEGTEEDPERSAVPKLKVLWQSRIAWVLVLALVVVSLGVAFYFMQRHPSPASVKIADSIAVLPFDSGPEFEYMADGITESTIDHLSQSADLEVISLGSVLHYRGKPTSPQEIGRSLSVHKVLIGKLRIEQEHLIVLVELINTADGTHIWGEQYDRRLSDVENVPEEISTEIATKLRAGLTEKQQALFKRRYTDDFEAYKLYIRGRYYWNKRDVPDLERGLSYFQQAIDRDPTYALAYAGLADSYWVECAAGVVPPLEGMPKAKAAATTALQLDDSLAEAHASLGQIHLNYDWDWSAAEAEYRKAIALSPSYSYAHYFYGTFLLAMARNPEALKELRRAQELDPLSPMVATFIAKSYYYSRDYDDAIAQFRHVLESNPDFPVAQNFLVETLERTGLFEEALRQMAANNAAGDPSLLALRRAYQKGGGRAYLEERIRQVDHIPNGEAGGLSGGTAALYSIIGARDEAIARLQRAYERHEIWLLYINVDPVWDNLRSDPRFQKLVHLVGLS